MKKIALLFVSLYFLPQLIHAQFQGVIGQLGFGLGKTTMNPFTWTNAPTGPNGQEETTLGAKASSSVAFPFVGTEGYAKHAMYQTTFGFGLKTKVKQYPGLVSKRDGDEMSLRLAFGFYIKKTVGIMVGAHYQWMPVIYDGPTDKGLPLAYNYTGPPEGTFYTHGAGGNLYGFNVNALISLGDQMLLRYTYLSSKTSVKFPGSDKFFGNARQSEVAAYFILDNNKSTGLFLKFTSLNRKMNPVTTADAQFVYSGGRVNIPALNAKSVWITFGYARNFH